MKKKNPAYEVIGEDQTKVMAFTNGIGWADYIGFTEWLRKFTKEDVVKFANQYYGDNYVLTQTHG